MKKLPVAILLLAAAATLTASAAQKTTPKTIYHKGWIDFNKNGRMDPFEDPSRSLDERVEDLLGQMTLEEKSCQLATLYGYGRVLRDSLPTEGWKNEVWKDGIANIDEMLNGVGKCLRTTPHLVSDYTGHVEAKNTVQRWFVEQTRLGIPVEFTNEGIHGLNHSRATPLPAPIAIGSTWNRALVHRAGEIAGLEARVLGYRNVYAPILDVARDPRWGRVVECYGEDPFLIAELGVEMVRGIQSQGVASTLKHYAAYSVPKGGRDGNCRTDPHIAPRELHQMYLYPFRRVIRESRPMGVMSSYNDWDGVPVTSSRYFLTDLLRHEYGFDGYVVSDSEAVEYVHTKHAVAETYEEAVRQVLEAGLNVRTNFSPPARFVLPVRKLVEEGRLSMEVVDQRVREVLRVKFREGLFDNPYNDPKEAVAEAGADKHRDFMLDIQRQSLVLLKNEGKTLPLDKAKTARVLVAGPLADEDNFMISRYGPNDLPTTTVLDGIRNYLGAAAEVRYAKGCDVVDAGFPDSELTDTPLTAAERTGIDEAVKQAAGCDVIVAVLGEDDERVGESHSRTSLELPGRQQQLLEALHATGVPVVLVLINGQPLTVNWASQNVPAILESWFPSVEGGTAIAETLFGDYNPGGKLTITFPRSTGQIELNFPYKKGSHGAQPRKGPNGGGVTRVLGSIYPFGYGLSYTTFAYKNLRISPEPSRTQGSFRVSCEVTNTGDRRGDEVVQLYISDKFSSVVTYESVLRGFERVTLEPGETKRVSFEITPSHLELLDSNMNWTVEPGEFEIRIGASSEDIRLKETIRLS
ncbi:MAG: glycoside hydrolase family 3 C-terminal domain-containing protein [Alistipes sp.]|nr:glycoside hydrolase family 3 C-terminal domain-containing protein [Alistipes sp.]